MLTQEEAQGLVNEIVKNCGCPPTVKDRLDAYAAGVLHTINFIRPAVSLDTLQEIPEEEN